MAHIYVITNTVNGKQYVGKTCGSVEKRFAQHLRDCTKRKVEKRPLYRAILKHGKENPSKLKKRPSCRFSSLMEWIRFGAPDC